MDQTKVPASSSLDALAQALGPGVVRDAPLANYTAMRVGGPGDLLVVCETTDKVVRAVELARSFDVGWRLLGGGCNVLVADSGIRGLVIVNRAAHIRFDLAKDDGRGKQAAWVEAGAQLAALARAAVGRGLAGLEWAAGLPGTVGGAVIGNAGAFEGDIANVLSTATVLGPDGKTVERPADWFEFAYRSSRIKRETTGNRSGAEKGGHIVLATTFELQRGIPKTLTERADEILDWRKTRHPVGATMGSTFKNPPGSHAGYLIEQAGLRGYRIGGAQISELHGNFFMNAGDATATDVLALIDHAREEVKRQFGVEMELEIEFVGW